MTDSHFSKRGITVLKGSIFARIKVDLWRIKHDVLGVRTKYLDQETPRRFPTEVQIEATSKCNLRCPACSHSRENDSGKHLTLGDLKIILDRLPFPIKRVILSGTGEPLLNPEFFSLVDCLAAREIVCSFITNGTLLTPQICEAIVKRRNIDYVAISCDGAEKKTFESLRLGANFETWIQFVHHFLNKVKQERPDLTTSVNTVITKQNRQQLENVIRLAADLGYHKIQFLDLIPIDDMVAENRLSKSELLAINFKELFELGTLLRLKVSWSIRRDKVPPKAIPRCLRPWELLFIRANGNVLACPANYSTDKLVVMGNIFQTDFEDIWNGDRFREYRKTNVLGTNLLCRMCPFY
jgi:MoaA/NifB/PqqE/SkfB family radical SAM enzyme